MAEAKGEEPKKNIYLVPYPKVVFMYPTLIAAILAGIFMFVAGDAPSERKSMVSLVFLLVFGVNLVVLSFDFPRTTSLTLFFIGVAIGLGLWLLFTFNPDLLPVVGRIISGMNPFANATFYFLMAGVLSLIYVAVFVNVRFDYWEVRPNELLHHHGILSNLERFSAPNLRIDKEINDVFEYALLRTGRLILHPSDERRAIVLENIPFINRKEAEITKMLGALQVQIGTESR